MKKVWIAIIVIVLIVLGVLALRPKQAPVEVTQPTQEETSTEVTQEETATPEQQARPMRPFSRRSSRVSSPLPKLPPRP